MSTPSRNSRPALVAPVAPVLQSEGIEIRFIWRYIAVAGLVAGCALLSAWSRVDLVETSVALDKIRVSHSRATAEHERLLLELASLKDPHTLRDVSTTLAFDGTVAVVDVP